MIATSGRRAGLDWGLTGRILLAWLGVCVIFIATRWPMITGMQLSDPDDTLRLVQVRDLLAGQAFWDLHQYRIDPPAGVAMHWSRLVDLPLAGLILLLRPLLGQAGAEQVTLVVVPLLTLGGIMLLTARLALRLVDRQLIWFALPLVAVASPLIAQVQPLRIDHHGWQIVAALAALNGLFARSPWRAGWISGTALALGMTISLELLPLAALIGAVLGLRAILDPAQRGAPAGFLQALALVGGTAFVATRGLGDLAGHCDTLSPPYLAGLAIAALGASLLAAVRVTGVISRTFALALCAGTMGATILLLAPQCASGPFAAIDPLVRSFWLVNVLEGMPVWHQPLPVMLQMTLVPLIGLLGVARLWHEVPTSAMRALWRDYGLVLAGAIVLGVLVARSAALACAIAAVPLAWQVRRWIEWVRGIRQPAVRMLGLVAIAAAIMPGVVVIALSRIMPGEPGNARPQVAMQLSCDISAALPMLNAKPPATILAPLDLGPLLLAKTHHRVVATGHHRATTAMRDLISAFIAPPEKARPIIAAHGARYVMLCPGQIEVDNYANADRDGLMARLLSGRAPAWLRPVTTPGTSGLLIWEVI